jgi:hypothetical protein
MVKRRFYSKWALAAIVGGVALTAIEIIGAVGYLSVKTSAPPSDARQQLTPRGRLQSPVGPMLECRAA